MNRLSQIILFAFMLTYLVPAQAMLTIGTGINVCPIFAEDDTEEDKKEDGKKAGEPEPDCE